MGSETSGIVVVKEGEKKEERPPLGYVAGAAVIVIGGTYLLGKILLALERERERPPV